MTYTHTLLFSSPLSCFALLNNDGAAMVLLFFYPRDALKSLAPNYSPSHFRSMAMRRGGNGFWPGKGRVAFALVFSGVAFSLYRGTLTSVVSNGIRRGANRERSRGLLGDAVMVSYCRRESGVITY